MDKHTMATYVRTILTDKAKDIYLRNHEFEYYGWVAKKVPKELEHVPHVDRGHWLGASHEAKARQAVHDAEEQLEHARAYKAGLLPVHPNYATAQAAFERAQRQVNDAREALDTTLAKIQEAIARRRQFRIDKLVTKLFMRYYHRARLFEWNLYDARLPGTIREYLLLQLNNKKLSPTALVFLWLVVEENIDHGDVFQIKGLGTTDYLAKHALAVSPYDIDAPENLPTRMEREYIRELQKADVEPAHENLDPRDNRLDHTYDGLPALGVLGGKEETAQTCPTCGNFRRERVLHLKGRYYLAEACDNYATKCRFERLTAGFATRQALHEHLSVHSELTASA